MFDVYFVNCPLDSAFVASQILVSHLSILIYVKIFFFFIFLVHWLSFTNLYNLEGIFLVAYKFHFSVIRKIVHIISFLKNVAICFVTYHMLSSGKCSMC